MATAKDVDQLLESFVERGLPGCSLKVMQRGNTLYEGYFGYTDLTSKAPVTKDSLFRQASMSKIPLYTAMMMLYERGKFLLSDPVGNYLPEWKTSTKYLCHANGCVSVVPTERPITIRDTLSMKCGLPYCNSDASTQDMTLRGMQECMRPLWEKGHYTLQEQLAAVSAAPLACEPGSHWIYGFSSELAAGIIEKICDKPVNDALKELLFDPLEMENTAAIFFDGARERLVALYALDAEGKYGPGPDFFDKKHLPGAENEAGWARLFSNVEDYSHLMQMLACGGTWKDRRVMSRKTIDLMRSNTLDETQLRDFPDRGYGYGYGFRTLIDRAAGDLNGSLGSFGWTGGFGSWCEADPQEGLSIVYMHNLIPNDEQYYHPRIRAISYALL
ncbi:MAG: beta-lactamase family protein [bacterium]|nr:beta-lactamase family protein [bacterium]MCM1373891.1 beta-lactamase family protein [Muribaculum sp.]